MKNQWLKNLLLKFWLLQREGAAVKKRIDTHKMAEANKAFSPDLTYILRDLKYTRNIGMRFISTLVKLPQQSEYSIIPV